MKIDLGQGFFLFTRIAEVHPFELDLAFKIRSADKFLFFRPFHFQIHEGIQ